MNAAALHARLYGPSSSELAARLPDVGDSLSGACSALARDTRADRADLLLAKLNGAVALVTRLRVALVAESQPEGQKE